MSNKIEFPKLKLEELIEEYNKNKESFRIGNSIWWKN